MNLESITEQPGEITLLAANAHNTEAHIFRNIAHDMMLEVGRPRAADKIIQWRTARGL